MKTDFVYETAIIVVCLILLVFLMLDNPVRTYVTNNHINVSRYGCFRPISDELFIKRIEFLVNTIQNKEEKEKVEKTLEQFKVLIKLNKKQELEKTIDILVNEYKKVFHRLPFDT